jgi:hypothetical protein
MFSDIYIWSSPRIASNIDRKATLCLIEIVSSPEFAKKLKDKSSKKKSIWKDIAEKLNKRGFKLNTDYPGEKVHQIWRNMEREYRSYIEHKKKTGEGNKKQPEFFDKLHKIFSVRHSVNPVVISDTSSLSLPTPSSDKVMASNNSSDTTEVTTDATPSQELDRNNNELNKKTSATLRESIHQNVRKMKKRLTSLRQCMKRIKELRKDDLKEKWHFMTVYKQKWQSNIWKE